jgi:hypothetical protein
MNRTISYVPYAGVFLRLLLPAAMLASCADLPHDPSAPASVNGAAASAVTYVTSIPIRQKERIHVTVVSAAAERCVAAAVSGAVSETLFAAVGPCGGAGPGGGTGQTKTSAMAAAAGSLTFSTAPAGAATRISVVPDSVQTYRVELDDGSGALDYGDVVLRVEVLAQVTDFGATGADESNDQPALQALLDDSRGYANIYFPPGTYHVDDRVLVRRSNVRLWGNIGAEGTSNSRLFARFPNGRAIIDIEANGHNASPFPRLKNVTVERLFFQGGGQTWAFGVLVVSSDSVRVRHNRARNIGLARSVASGGEPARSLWIEDNLVDNDAAYLKNGTFGVLLDQGTDGAWVRRNSISHVYNGIEWWGGNADPDSDQYDSTRTQRSRNLTIERNTVRNTSAGIFGMNGRHIVVHDNTVEVCADMCLDAEGSHDVRFTFNRARHAGTSVLGVYYFSSRVVFEDNIVEQDGRFWDHEQNLSHPGRPGHRMLYTANPWGVPDSISIELRRNTFTYTGSGTSGIGVGVLEKLSTKSVIIDDNVLNNTVIEMASNNNGLVRVVNNDVNLTRNARRPAILVGSNHDSGASAALAEVSGNMVGSSAAQDSAGIQVWQWMPGTAVSSSITGNSVSGFATSILYQNDNHAHAWNITGNGHDGRIARRGNQAPGGYVGGNTYTGPVAEPPCKPGMICHPT